MSVSPLAALRQELRRQGLDGFIVPRADEHLGEYVPAAAERLAWLTGFTGSAGLAVVLAAVAAVFTDGRYVLQLAEQTDQTLWQRLHVTEQPPPTWLAHHAPKGARIGYDPLLISEEGLGRYTDAGVDMVAVEHNPIDTVWTDRPKPPGAPALPHPLAYAGRTSEEKRADVAKLLREAKQDAAVLTDPASIAWLLNIRGGDVPFTPFALGFALVHADGATDLFMTPGKLPPDTRAWLGNAVSVADRDALAPALREAGGQDRAGRCVRIAGVVRPAASQAGRDGVAASDPCLLAEGLQEPDRTAGCARRTFAGCGGGMSLPALAVRRRARRPGDGNFRRRVAAGVPPSGGRISRRELPGDLGRRRAWRDHPLPRDRRSRTARSSRMRST